MSSFPGPGSLKERPRLCAALLNDRPEAVGRGGEN